MTTPPPLPNKPPRDWWSRNWKWLVPSIIAVGVAGIVGFVLAIGAIIKTSDAYRGAVQLSRVNPAVIAALGSPVEEGLLVTGSVNVSGPSGRANLAIPISGPKGKATIYVDARKALGEWHFDHLIVQLQKTTERINVLEAQETKQR